MDSFSLSQTASKAHLAMTIGALSVIGGTIGYMKTKSVPSVTAGVGIGGSLLAAGYLIDRGNVPLGFQLATGASVALGAAMTTRYVKTKKLLPSGVLAVLGTVSAAYYAIAAVEYKPT